MIAVDRGGRRLARRTTSRTVWRGPKTRRIRSASWDSGTGYTRPMTREPPSCEMCATSSWSSSTSSVSLYSCRYQMARSHYVVCMKLLPVSLTNAWLCREDPLLEIAMALEKAATTDECEYSYGACPLCIICIPPFSIVNALNCSTNEECDLFLTMADFVKRSLYRFIV